MKFTLVPIALMLLLPAVTATASPGGKLETLPRGLYTCALPGDALAEAFVVLQDKGFVIDNGSTYRTESGTGTYLMTGSEVRFTRGPMNGMRFQRTGPGSLRWIDDNGQPSRVRCVRNVR